MGMKKFEVLKRVDTLCKNPFSAEEKRAWCAELDAMLKKEYYRMDAPDVGEEETLPPPPYDAMYIDFVMAKCCYYQRDFDAYNQHITAFNSKLSDFSNWYIRTHMPERETENKIKNWI